METHCLLVNGDRLAKGVAKCSRKDSPCKKTGKHIAYMRAKQAIDNQCSQMDKGKLFWKKLSNEMVISHMTRIDEKLLKSA